MRQNFKKRVANLLVSPLIALSLLLMATPAVASAAHYCGDKYDIKLGSRPPLISDVLVRVMPSWMLFLR